MDNDRLLNLLHKVQTLRIAVEGNKAAIALRREALEKELTDTVAATKDLEVLLKQEEDGLRMMAVVEYQETGVKRFPGVEVVTAKVLRYEPAKAFAWAKEHDLALALDVRTFDALAKAGQVPDIVQIEEQPGTRIARDLAPVVDGLMEQLKEREKVAEPDGQPGIRGSALMQEI